VIHMNTEVDQDKLRYVAVEEAILNRITSGELKLGDRLETTPRLAQQMKVGEGTIRHALQSLAGRGFLARRPRVGTIVSRIPDDHTDSRPERRTQTTYVLIVPDIRNPQFVCLARGVQDAAATKQIDVVTCNTDDDPKVYESIIDRCIQNHADGLIMVPPMDHVLPLRTLAKLQDAKIPVVTCWRPIDAAGWPLVRGDSFNDVRTGVRHFVEQGYEEIAMVLGKGIMPKPGVLPPEKRVMLNQSVRMFTDYENGYARGLQDANRGFDESLIMDFQFNLTTISSDQLDKHPAVDMLVDWLEAHATIDAVICTHDFVAALFLHALMRMGKRVPDDFGLIGGGNIPIYHSALQGKLTSLDGHFPEIGEAACSLLEKIHDGEAFPPGYVKIIPSRLVVGTSTTRP
jgi:DNA-binding LacI/PurR family transcriptional regulator